MTSQDAATSRPDTPADATGRAADGTYRFDRAIDVTADGGPDRWAADVDPDFSIGGRTNGGYLLALAARAATARLDADGGPHLDPVAASGAFVAVAPPGPVALTTTVLRTGRGTSAVRVAVHDQDDAAAVYLDALVTCGSLPGPSAAHRHDAVPPIALPPRDQCHRLPDAYDGRDVALMKVLHEDLDPGTLGWARGRPSGAGELRGWVSFEDDRPVDALSLVLAADCLPPATFDLGLAGWVPTMHLSVWLRAHPAPGPLQVRQVARVVDDGSAGDGYRSTVDETCDVWDSEGTLVATGHQLAGVLLPR